MFTKTSILLALSLLPIHVLSDTQPPSSGQSAGNQSCNDPTGNCPDTGGGNSGQIATAAIAGTALLGSAGVLGTLLHKGFKNRPQSEDASPSVPSPVESSSQLHVEKPSGLLHSSVASSPSSTPPSPTWSSPYAHSPTSSASSSTSSLPLGEIPQGASSSSTSLPLGEKPASSIWHRNIHPYPAPSAQYVPPPQKPGAWVGELLHEQHQIWSAPYKGPQNKPVSQMTAYSPYQGRVDYTSHPEDLHFESGKMPTLSPDKFAGMATKAGSEEYRRLFGGASGSPPGNAGPQGLHPSDANQPTKIPPPAMKTTGDAQRYAITPDEFTKMATQQGANEYRRIFGGGSFTVDGADHGVQPNRGDMKHPTAAGVVSHAGSPASEWKPTLPPRHADNLSTANQRTPLSPTIRALDLATLNQRIVNNTRQGPQAGVAGRQAPSPVVGPQPTAGRTATVTDRPVPAAPTAPAAPAVKTVSKVPKIRIAKRMMR